MEQAPPPETVVSDTLSDEEPPEMVVSDSLSDEESPETVVSDTLSDEEPPETVVSDALSDEEVERKSKTIVWELSPSRDYKVCELYGEGMLRRCSTCVHVQKGLLCRQLMKME